MSDRDTIIIMDEEYNIGNTDETVQGASIVIDGSFKQVLDRILSNNPQFSCYNDLIKEAVYLGLIEIITSEVNPSYKHKECNYNEMPKDFDKTEYEEIPFDEFDSLTNMAVENNIEYYD